jgi:uncharacterized protein YjiS (DUF1127 family)
MAARRLIMSAYDVKVHPAFSGYDLPEATSFMNRVRRLLVRISVWSQDRRAYHQAFDELQALGDRDLADIGIARCDIPFIAQEAAKEKIANGR